MPDVPTRWRTMIQCTGGSGIGGSVECNRRRTRFVIRVRSSGRKGYLIYDEE